MECVQTKVFVYLDSGRRPELKTEEFLFVHTLLLRYLQFWSRFIRDLQTLIGNRSLPEAIPKDTFAKRASVAIDMPSRGAVFAVPKGPADGTKAAKAPAAYLRGLV